MRLLCVVASMVLACCGGVEDDDDQLEPRLIHLNLTPGQPPPAGRGSPVAGTPCDKIVTIAVAENGGGPYDVGKKLTAYPFELSNYLKSGEAWCSEFVSWVYEAAGVVPFTGGYEGGWMLKDSYAIRSWFQNNKSFISKGSTTWSTFKPEPGDYIRYNTSGGGHSGMVHYVDGTTLHTVEGNVSNLVKLRTISNWTSYSSIDGIGRLGLGCSCTTDSQCNDGDPCTADKCVAGACQHDPVPGCCTSDGQCNDNNPCTTDRCAVNVCQHDPLPGCCTGDGQCNDGDPCTTDRCAANVCQHDPLPGCCTGNGQCDDNDPSTEDHCVGNVCQHMPRPDGGASPPDNGSVAPAPDVTPDPQPAFPPQTLVGGCSLAVQTLPVGVPLPLVLLLPLCLCFRRRGGGHR